jgi:hypothetical protein
MALETAALLGERARSFLVDGMRRRDVLSES